MEESKELAVAERAAVALGTAEHEKALIELSKKYADIVELKNAAAREQCHAAYMTLKNARIAIEKAGKDARDDAVKFGKAVISEVDRLTAITAAEEARLQALRDEFDAEVAREKAAKAAAEKARVAAIRARIDLMRNTPASMVGKLSTEIGACADHLSETVISLDEYAELAGEAQVERNHAVTKLREMQAKQFAIEQAAAEAARQAEADRIERERVAEANRIEAKRLADLATEIERQAQEARAKQEEADRIAQEQREAEETRLRQEREAAEAKLLAEREAEQRKLDEQRREFERQQAEFAVQQQALREATEKLAREQREREEAEAARIAAAARLEADHAEAIEENNRIDSGRAASIEAARVEAARLADLAEKTYRERVQFEMNGPGDVEIVKTLADFYSVTVGDVMQWMKKFDYAATDEVLAAENVAANQREAA